MSHSCRRFVPAEGREAAGWLQPGSTELRLAQLFDGDSDAETIRQRARAQLQLELSSTQLEAFAARLAVAGLLQPGFWEPLPSPALTERGQRHPGLVAAAAVMPPSTMPGSLAGPGSFGGLLGLVTDRRGVVREPWATLDATPWLAFGRALNWPLAGRGAILLAAWLMFSLFGLWQLRLEAAADLLRLRGWVPLAGLLWLALTLIHVFAQSARAAAVERHAGLRPQLGLVRGPFILPLVHVDTRGAVERADRAARSRIVASALTALAVLFNLSVLLWFLTRGSASPVPSTALWIGVVTLFTLVLRLNPLARRDGYYLLAQRLGIPDLREQAVAAMLGFARRGWVQQQKRLSRAALVLYCALGALSIAVLMGLFLAMPGRWATARFGGIGFLLVVVFMGVLVSQSYRNSRGSANTDLGVPGRPWWQFWAGFSRNTWTAIALGAVLLLLPFYRYHASGDFVVLPSDRADVRALTAGDVREVLVQEGDLVQAGQVIARISDYEQRALVAAAEAQLAQLHADLALARKGGKAEEVQVAEGAVETAQKRAEVSAAQARRLQAAHAKKSVTAQEYDRARGVAEVDAKALEEARRKLALVRSPAVDERVAAIEAQLRQARAELDYQKQRLAYTEITAPIAGRVVSGSLRFSRGTFLNRGDALAVIEDAGQRVAEVKVPETAIGELRLDNAVSAKAWAYPGSSFGGKVLGIAPAAEDGEYGKVVRVRVALADPQNRLIPGVTGNAKVAGDRHSLLVVFTRALARFLFVEVWSWIP